MNEDKIIYSKFCQSCGWDNVEDSESCFQCSGTMLSYGPTTLENLKHQHQWKNINMWMLKEDKMKRIVRRWQTEFRLEILL